MGRFSALLLLLIVTAQADTLSFGPERELVPRRMEEARDLRFAGAATDGREVLLLFSKMNVETHEITSYVGLASAHLQQLPTTEQALGVVWSGASYFVVTDKHLFPIARDGRIRAPRDLPARESGFRASTASNGNGFLLATDGPGWRLLVRLFDRDGRPRTTLTLYGAQVFDVATRGRDYAVFLTAHETTVSRVIVHPNGTHEIEMVPPKKVRSPWAIAGARDAAIVHEMDPISNTLCLAGRAIDLGPDAVSAPLAWDGASYLVLTPKELRRYAPDGTLRESAAGDYERPLAIVTRRGRPPFVLWQTKDDALHASGGALALGTTAEQTAPAASSDGASAIVAWREQNGIAATVFATPGEPHVTIDLKGSKPSTNINTISLAGVHYVVWRDESSIRMTRLNARGDVLDAQPVLLAPAAKSPWAWPSSANTPGLAADGRKALVTWCADNRIWASWLTPGQPPEEAFVVESPPPSHYAVAAHAAFNGRDFVVVWTEQEPSQSSHAPAIFGIYSSVVRGRAATMRQAIVGTALPIAQLVLAPARAMWPEYRSRGPYDRDLPNNLEIWTAPLTAEGAASAKAERIALLDRAEWSMQTPAVDLTVYGTHALWSEQDALMAMPLDAEWKSAGDPVKIGEASNGTLRMVETNAGTLLVYARRDGGVSRIFVRAVTALPNSARTAPDTSAPGSGTKTE
jgi:hypothetical protein